MPKTESLGRLQKLIFSLLDGCEFEENRFFTNKHDSIYFNKIILNKYTGE